MINDICFMQWAQWHLLTNSMNVFWLYSLDFRCIVCVDYPHYIFIERKFHPLVIFLKNIEKRVVSHYPLCDSMHLPQDLIYPLLITYFMQDWILVDLYEILYWQFGFILDQYHVDYYQQSDYIIIWKISPLLWIIL